jgi:precorrin-6A/cobalt-precorrin-6A reductase
MIWLIGGTSESVVVAKLIAQHQLNFIVSVTTDNACRLYDSIAVCQVFASKLTQNMIVNFIHQYNITTIVDCSHPFAQEISQSVIAVCQSLNLPYLRYERPEVDIADSHSLITSVASLESLVRDNSPLQGKRVLLTIGAKYLPLFRHYQSSAWLYTRILPYPQSLKLAYQGGFTCDRIIALRPPISKELEKALWQLWQIEVVVTKAGGKAAGEDIKYQVAQALNVHLIVIPRPQVNYPQSTSNLGDVQKFISNFI